MLGVVFVKPLVLFCFNVLCAAFIAFRARLRYVPGSLKEIVIPIAGTTIVLCLPLSEHLPVWLGRPIAYPPAWTLGVYTAAAALSVAGALIALFGLLHLRRNFSVFVEVREVVFSGPYRYVRHPLYVGEILLGAGLVLTVPSVFGLVVLGLLVAFQYLRARMEEAQLAAASPRYRERFATTGMFFPPLRRRPAAEQPPSAEPAAAGSGKVPIGLALAAVVAVVLWIGTRPPDGASRSPDTLSPPPGGITGEAGVSATGGADADTGAAAGPSGELSTGNQIDAMLQAAQDAYARREWRRAADLYTQLVAAAPTAPELPLLLGFCCLQIEDNVRARDAYEEALRRMPESPDAANGLAWTLLETGGSVQRAVTLAEFAIGRAPSPYTYDTLARAYAKAHDCDRAQEAAQRILELAPDGEIHRQTLRAIERMCP
jgi:protein-S-isoprenylcysteine O-methyltransferase Ste14/Flp pilus assembly protein TadD